MTAAVIALAAALLAAVGGLIALALKLADAERRNGDARSDEATLAEQLKTALANEETQERRADAEKERGDALDAALADAAATGPTDGAFDRLLSRWQATRAAAGGDGATAVRNAGASGSETSGADPDGLLRPGE